MFQLLFTIASYGSLLLLLMQPTGKGVITTAAMLVLGIGLIIYKKGLKATFRKDKPYHVIPVILINIYLGLIFYSRWLPSSKIQVIANLFHMPIELLLILGAATLSVLSAYFTSTGLQITTTLVSNRDQTQTAARILFFCLIASVTTVIAAQKMIYVKTLSMGLWNFMWGILIVLTVILFLYCLFAKIMLSVFLGSGIFIIISTINTYIYIVSEAAYLSLLILFLPEPP